MTNQTKNAPSAGRGRIGVLFSAFDFIHPGHIAMLQDGKVQSSSWLVDAVKDKKTKS